MPWPYRTSWIRSLIVRASRICSTDKLPYEINIIKRFASWNDFPESVVNSIINKTLNTPSITADSNDANEINNGVTIYFRVPYYGDKGFSLLNPAFVKSNQITKKNSQLTSEFSMMSLKLISSVAPKIKRQH